MTGLAACRREDRHNLHVSASAFRTDKIEQPGNVNEYCFIGELDLIEGQLRTMAAFDAPAMNREPGFARRRVAPFEAPPKHGDAVAARRSRILADRGLINDLKTKTRRTEARRVLL